MTRYDSRSYRIFYWCNIFFLTVASLACLAPLIHVLAISFSNSMAAGTGRVLFWPIDFTLEAYSYALSKKEFIQSFLVSVNRAVLATTVQMALTILFAFPLSKEKAEFPHRNLYAIFIFITMVFSGGLIPWYLTIKATNLIDTIWAFVLPGALPVFHVIILLNFFRQLPKELGESAYIDGASDWKTLWRIYVPLSRPALATLVLFCVVFHWNSWFDGLILMNLPKNYPLQTFLQTLIVKSENALYYNLTTEELKKLAAVSDRTNKAAQIFIGALPILCVYPFLQKHFVKGLVLGSVKG